MTRSPTRTYVTVPMTPAERAALQRLADADHRTLSGYIRALLVRHLAGPEPTQPKG